MITGNICQRMKLRQGMTLLEMLLVVSLVSMITLALYNVFANGLRIWERSKDLVLEEDIAIFLDKLSVDLRNTYQYSKLLAEGGENRFSFPTVIRTLADPRKGLPEETYIDQLGMVEYYFDFATRNIYRRQATYGAALKKDFSEPVKLIANVYQFKFRYVYLTDSGERISDAVLEYLPYGVDVEVQFKDRRGVHALRRFIDLPLNG